MLARVHPHPPSHTMSQHYQTSKLAIDIETLAKNQVLLESLKCEIKIILSLKMCDLFQFLNSSIIMYINFASLSNSLLLDSLNKLIIFGTLGKL